MKCDYDMNKQGRKGYGVLRHVSTKSTMSPGHSWYKCIYLSWAKEENTYNAYRFANLQGGPFEINEGSIYIWWAQKLAFLRFQIYNKHSNISS